MSKVLIHIGYSKAGSSYLQQWFNAHPELYHRPKAIAGFYDAFDLVKYAQKEDKQPAYFVLSSEHLSVWKGNYDLVNSKNRGYELEAYHERLTKTLNDIFNAPHILIITRGFSGMLRSLYSQYVRGGGILSFEELNTQYGADFDCLYDYTWLINLYRKVFGTEKVIVLPFELLKNDPNQFTGVLEDKLGIEKHFKFTEEKINPSLNPKELAAIRRVSTLVFNATRIFPASLQTKIYDFHIERIKNGDESLLIKLLAMFCKEEDMTVTPAMLSVFKTKAEILRTEPLFQSYLKDYLLD